MSLYAYGIPSALASPVNIVNSFRGIYAGFIYPHFLVKPHK